VNTRLVHDEADLASYDSQRAISGTKVVDEGGWSGRRGHHDRIAMTISTMPGNAVSRAPHDPRYIEITSQRVTT
jgi:hypothetical protein